MQGEITDKVKGKRGPGAPKKQVGKRYRVVGITLPPEVYHRIKVYAMDTGSTVSGCLAKGAVMLMESREGRD